MKSDLLEVELYNLEWKKVKNLWGNVTGEFTFKKQIHIDFFTDELRSIRYLLVTKDYVKDLEQKVDKILKLIYIYQEQLNRSFLKQSIKILEDDINGR